MLSVSTFQALLSNLSAPAANPWRPELNIPSIANLSTISNSHEQLFSPEKARSDYKSLRRCIIPPEGTVRLDPYTVNRTSRLQPGTDSYFAFNADCEYSAIGEPVGPHSAFMQAVAGETIPSLLVAAAENNVGLIKLLLRKKGKIEVRDAQGRSALMYSSEFKSYHALNVLLKHGASISGVCKQHQTVLMYAIRQDNTRSVARLLKEPNPALVARMINAQDNKGVSALMLAAGSADPAAVKAEAYSREQHD